MSDNCYKKRNQSRDEYIEQENRLTNRHIQALSLMQDIHRENEELKKELKQLQDELSHCEEYHRIAKDAKAFKQQAQEDCLKKIDRNSEKLNRKHKEEVMSLVSAKLQAETDWLEERERFQQLVEQYEKQNAALTDQLEALKKHDIKIDVVNQRLDQSLREMIELKETNKQLNLQIEQLQEENIQASTYLEKIEQVEREKETLELELQEVQQRLREFELRVKVLEEELSAVGQQTKERHSAKSKLRHQLEQAGKEIAGYQKQIMELEDMVSDLRKDLSERTSQRDQEASTKEKLLIFLQQLQEECRRLKEELASRQQEKQVVPERVGFREFVQMRREMNVLKEENDSLRQNKKKPKSLPSLKGPSPDGYLYGDSRTPGQSKSETALQLLKR
ncbi:trichohyalin-like [Lytechinus variegatus]|uniref:trichohyalin-like n=1 Tax=Lytechinus variegatus TaxID=7654 RepID=UPI001BB28758|nr:trichohyalin-like [Lytechinus variegatus]